MIEKIVYVVEDNELAGYHLKEILLKEGYAVSLFTNGVEALDAFKKVPCHVLVTDIEMPEMNGNELISAILEIEEEQIIIVTTAHNESSMIIDIMKKGIYDYIMKPIIAADIIHTVKRALETDELRKMKSIMEREKAVKLQNQIDWFTWNENIISRNYDRVDESLFTNLHSSFNQGAGFGSLLTLVSMISMNAEKVESGYIIDEQFFNLILENAKISEKILGIFSELVTVIKRDLVLERVSVEVLHSFLQKIVDDMRKYSSESMITLAMSDPKPMYKNTYVNINFESFKKAFNEIIINAFKFSKPDTTIMVLLNSELNDLVVSVINSPEIVKENVVGIPFEYENIVFEPFFRMGKMVYEAFGTPDYGLGLTLVEKIVKKHNAKVSISNILDSSQLSKPAEVKVIVSVSFPIAK